MKNAKKKLQKKKKKEKIARNITVGRQVQMK
jgi:hypothetical protein